MKVANSENSLSQKSSDSINLRNSLKHSVLEIKLQSGPKVVGPPLSLFSFIHPFTVLTLIFCLFSSGIVTPNPCIQMQFPLPTPCFNVALNSGVRASVIWINIENGERGKSLAITPQWSNTFGPDCSNWPRENSKLEKLFKNLLFFK